ncbi:MAG: hypothetical protein FWE06_08545 [Oscillospiraceae bacterium]|nr:hypothetical protein [Oscillospiraceae bacterium]
MSKAHDNPALSNEFDAMITGKYTNLFEQVSGTVFKSSLPFIEYVKPRCEVDAGAHYYLHSTFDNYKTASMTVDLSEVSANCYATKGPNKGKQTRNAYICLTPTTSKMICDIGLVKGSGEKWAPFAWGKIWAKEGSIEYFVKDGLGEPIDGTPTIEVKVEKYSDDDYDYFKAVMTNLDENNVICTLVVREDKWTIYNKDDEFEPWGRFVRFASLVPMIPPYGVNDTADGSYLDATLRNCKIGGKTWTDKEIEFAWSIQDENVPHIELSAITPTSIGIDADRVIIKHEHQVH